MPLLGGATSVLVVADALRAGPVRSSKTMSENVKQSEAVLRCRYGGHDAYEDFIKAAFRRGDGLIVIEGISARLCERCGEQFLDEQLIAVENIPARVCQHCKVQFYDDETAETIAAIENFGTVAGGAIRNVKASAFSLPDDENAADNKYHTDAIDHSCG